MLCALRESLRQASSLCSTSELISYQHHHQHHHQHSNRHRCDRLTHSDLLYARLLHFVTKMKSVLGIFTILALFVLLNTSHGHLDQTNGCETNCNITFDPICGTDDAGKTKMFTNECVLKSENCLFKTNYQRTANGTCP